MNRIRDIIKSLNKDKMKHIFLTPRTIQATNRFQEPSKPLTHVPIKYLRAIIKVQLMNLFQNTDKVITLNTLLGQNISCKTLP